MGPYATKQEALDAYKEYVNDKAPIHPRSERHHSEA